MANIGHQSSFHFFFCLPLLMMVMILVPYSSSSLFGFHDDYELLAVLRFGCWYIIPPNGNNLGKDGFASCSIFMVPWILWKRSSEIGCGWKLWRMRCFWGNWDKWKTLKAVKKGHLVDGKCSIWGTEIYNLLRFTCLIEGYWVHFLSSYS